MQNETTIKRAAEAIQGEGNQIYVTVARVAEGIVFGVGRDVVAE
jgi:hypothetical protein